MEMAERIMKKRHQTPAKRQDRLARREQQRTIDRRNEEKNRRKAKGGGQPNELGIVQGQNAEQGNAVDPHFARPLGRPSH
jgi:hypothetical protein